LSVLRFVAIGRLAAGAGNRKLFSLSNMHELQPKGKKTMKKVATLLMVSALAMVGLSACGNNAENRQIAERQKQVDQSTDKEKKQLDAKQNQLNEEKKKIDKQTDQEKKQLDKEKNNNNKMENKNEKRHK
jgi:Na+-translocating ferredoxin:NAD+ oxidoreductase RnfG subunit